MLLVQSAPERISKLIAAQSSVSMSLTRVARHRAERSNLTRDMCQKIIDCGSHVPTTAPPRSPRPMYRAHADA